MIGNAVFARLASVSGVTALVGANPSRIYPGVGPENPSYPLVLFNQVSSGQADARGLIGAAKYFRTIQQIDIYAATRSQADGLANAVRAALDGIESETTWGGMTIMLSMFDDQFDSGFEPDVNLHRIIQQYRIVYKEA
jgi:hypothetical protein